MHHVHGGDGVIKALHFCGVTRGYFQQLYHSKNMLENLFRLQLLVGHKRRKKKKAIIALENLLKIHCFFLDVEIFFFDCGVHRNILEKAFNFSLFLQYLQFDEIFIQQA